MGDVISLVRDLHRRRGRARRGRSLAEGVRLVEEALAAGAVERAVVAPALEGTERGRALKAALRESGAHLSEVDDRALADVADTEQPQGVIAVVRPPAYALDDLPVALRHPIVIADGVQDPGNLGALARTALGLGAAGLVTLPGTAELYGPKTLRGSMGALFRLPALRSEDGALADWLERRSVAVWVADAGGEAIGARAPAEGPVALVLGNEGAGVRDRWVNAAVARVAVPLSPNAESLNVTVAAGILLYEVTRER